MQRELTNLRKYSNSFLKILFKVKEEKKSRLEFNKGRVFSSIKNKSDAGESMERREPSHPIGENVNARSHCGEQYRGSLKN